MQNKIIMKEYTLQRIIQFSLENNKSLKKRMGALEALSIYCCAMIYIGQTGKVAAIYSNNKLVKQFWKNGVYDQCTYLKELSQLKRVEFFNECNFLSKILNTQNGMALSKRYNKGVLLTFFISDELKNSAIASNLEHLMCYIKCVENEIKLPLSKYLTQADENSYLAEQVLTFLEQEEVRISPEKYRPYKTNKISNKEALCLEMYVSGASYQEIAEKLFISKHTVSNHLKNLKFKFGISTPLEIVSLYNEVLSKPPSKKEKVMYV